MNTFQGESIYGLDDGYLLAPLLWSMLLFLVTSHKKYPLPTLLVANFGGIEKAQPIFCEIYIIDIDNFDSLVTFDNINNGDVTIRHGPMDQFTWYKW